MNKHIFCNRKNAVHIKGQVFYRSATAMLASQLGKKMDKKIHRIKKRAKKKEKDNV